MNNGLGTLVGYATAASTSSTGRTARPCPAGVSFARQNLPLIVDHGRPNPNLGNSAVWGATVGDAVLVWRSGIGIDRHGNLIYAAGKDQTVDSLAGALIRAGAVRAMELDINPYWVSFITYSGPARGPEEPASRHGPRGDALPRTGRPRLFHRLLALSRHAAPAAADVPAQPAIGLA